MTLFINLIIDVFLGLLSWIDLTKSNNQEIEYAEIISQIKMKSFGKNFLNCENVKGRRSLRG